jgi:hypothetical protein
MVQELFDNEAISKEAIPAGWSELFQKAVILKERDLDIILEGVIVSVSWDYDDTRDKLTVEDIKDYLVDAFRYLKGAYEVDSVVILGKGYWEVLHNSFWFVDFVERHFGLEGIMEQVKERWKNRESVVPWWYQEKLKAFEEYINSVLPAVVEVCSVVEEVKAVYVRRCRGRLKLYVCLVLFGEPIEYDEDEVPEEVERLWNKLWGIERELKERFPVVDFQWREYYESELSDEKLSEFSELELVYERKEERK